MIEMLKSKTIILFVIMILGTCFITALDNKKTVEPRTHNGQQINDLYNK